MADGTSRQIFPIGENTNQDCSSDSETEEDPKDSGVEELNKDFGRALAISNKKDGQLCGEYLPYHPWNSNNKPDPNLKMKETVAMSSKYPLSSLWVRPNKTGSQQNVDLVRIFSNLPKFVECEMQGSINGSRHEPHTREIVGEQHHPKDQKSLPIDTYLKATSIDPFERNNETPPEFYFYFDCEYTLTMYANGYQFPVQRWFDIQQREEIQWIRNIRYKMKLKRWIFIPSYRRAQIALLEWPQDDIVTEVSTIRILVVRPSEFEEYVTYCGHKLPVLCLPKDEIGAGYARYWIQKIAMRLKLQFIWMIDDSVECFYEYIPRQDSLNPGSFTEYRRRELGFVFERIEDVVQDGYDNEKPIAAMSPRRWNPKCRPKRTFSCKPPQGAVYLNLRALSEKNVYYRPELKTFEDMMFGFECEQKGLKVYRDNRTILQDHDWKNTGASSPSVKSKRNNNSEQQ